MQCSGCRGWFHTFCAECDEGTEDFQCPACALQVEIGQGGEEHPKPVTVQELKSQQSKDAFVVQVMEDLGNQVLPSQSSFTVHNDLLYRTRNGLPVQVVIPKTLQPTILRWYHDEPTSGHLGRDKTLQRILRFAWWKGIGDSVRSYVRACRVCQVTKPVYRRPPGYMGTVKAENVWETLAIDLVGPLPRSSSGNEHALVLEDVFSKFVQTVALRKATAKNVAV